MLKPGETFERYTIDAAIGQGGMGCVYRAHDPRLDRRVAIKLISDGAAGDDANARLLREARAAAALDHPNAVSIFDVGEHDGAPYIVMELVSGRTLREAIGDASVPLATRVAWLADVGRALAAAHKRGLVHRDIKPENVMVREDGMVKVLDFGIARRSASAVDPSAPTHASALVTLTKEGVKVGTPMYMAPEQIRGDALDGRADQFAWGVVAYELFTGKLPWRGAGEPLAAVASILTDEPPPGSLTGAGLSPEIAVVVRRALSKRAGDRFATMDDLVRALDAAVKGEVSSGRAADPASAPVSAPPVSPATATLLQRYSTGEVQEILARAVEQQEAKRDGRLAFDDLVNAAREVGVDPEVLRDASRAVRVRQEARAAEPGSFDAWVRRKKRGFYRHLGVWAIVNVAFTFIELADKGHPEFWKAGLLWAIALVVSGMRAFTASEDDWREEREKIAEKQRKEEQKERKKRRRAQAIDDAIDEGAALLQRTGAAVRQRLAASAPQPSPGRARIAASGTSTGRDAAAEEEAAAVEQAEAERRRQRM
jgi:eukaryotic-like serine/threonine-protein kinase